MCHNNLIHIIIRFIGTLLGVLFLLCYDKLNSYLRFLLHLSISIYISNCIPLDLIKYLIIKYYGIKLETDDLISIRNLLCLYIPYLWNMSIDYIGRK